MSRVYVGNLPGDVHERELDDMFARFRPRRIDLKFPPRGGAFAFVEFEDMRDAEDAMRARDGIDFAGGRIRVELSRPRDRDRDFRGPPGDRFGGDRFGGDRRGPPPRRNSELTLRVSGLPDRTSWQDLKDFARAKGDVNFAKMIGPDVGVVDYYNKEDFDRALAELEGADFKNRFGDITRVHVEPDSRGPPPPRDDRGPPRDDRGPPPRDGGRHGGPPRDGPYGGQRDEGHYGGGPPRDDGHYGGGPPRDDGHYGGGPPPQDKHDNDDFGAPAGAAPEGPAAAGAGGSDAPVAAADDVSAGVQ